jgi:hydrogenase nickel incorporation protein HypA/HybF
LPVVAESSHRAADAVGAAFACCSAVHELALMESIVDEVLDHLADGRLGDQHVAVIRLEIGTLSGVSAEALRASFDVCTARTILEGAALDIVAIEGTARCRTCDRLEPIAALGTPCGCGSFERRLVTGDELVLKELEVY